MEWEDYVLAVDYVNRYFEVAQLASTKNTTFINNIKAMFSRHGIPQIVDLSTVHLTLQILPSSGDLNI